MIVALAQLDSIVGDIDGNTDAILARVSIARDAGAHLVVFPELAVFGYPPKDLVMRDDLVRRSQSAIDRIASHCTNLTVIVGFVKPDSSSTGKGILNAAAVCRNGRVLTSYAKRLLPTYDVFDETRHFDQGLTSVVVDVPAGDQSVGVGLSICEDLWNDRQFAGHRVYGFDPIADTVKSGAELLINLSGSPYTAGKQTDRESIFREQIRKLSVPLAYVNQVGGNDDLIFDGASLALDAKGNVIARAKPFEEDLLIVDFSNAAANRIEPYPGRLEGMRQALVLGIRDYVYKCGFEKVVIGLSGGIDSALTAALAVEAIGAARVIGVAMPSRFSSEGSLTDAAQLASNLNIKYNVIPIEGAHAAMEKTLAPHFGTEAPGVAEENIQARIRGSILMALSNKYGWLLLTTGNKSELAVGYCTLYGDMCGGLAVLSDVPKTTAYELAHLINNSCSTPPIPEIVLTKPPSAELRENQTDQDTLPAYEILDRVLAHCVEEHRPPDDIVAMGFDRELVQRVVTMVQRAEYKRKQLPVGLKVTSLAFGTGRRMPIAAKMH
ncbi:MAG: NAD+ synthase [Planctomycetes bacterium]|nr:NAD+ synthase [Planctomycetota bacterium]